MITVAIEISTIGKACDNELPVSITVAIKISTTGKVCSNDLPVAFKAFH